MSWDIIVLKFGSRSAKDLNALIQSEETEALRQSDSMGTRDEVRALISKHLHVDWNAVGSHGIRSAGTNAETNTGYAIEISLSEENSISSFVLHVHCGSSTEDEILRALEKLRRPNNWALMDCSSGRFIEFEEHCKT